MDTEDERNEMIYACIVAVVMAAIVIAAGELQLYWAGLGG